MSNGVVAKAENYEYVTLRAETHTELAELLNEGAEHCWEPILYSIWSLGTGMGTNVERGTHFVILRRDTTRYTAYLAELRQDIESGEYSGGDRDWAEGILRRGEEDGYAD